jgi:FkbM family methyltransferase
VNVLEHFCIKLRHSPLLSRAEWLWDALRPSYNNLVALLAARGLERRINGTDTIRVSPAFRNTPEIYEPEVWQLLMSNVRSGDIIADVGAYVGLYTVALAQRIGDNGKVIAFEPDPGNFAALSEHVQLNDVGSRVKVVQAAVGAKDGQVPFHANSSSQSGFCTEHSQNKSTQVDCMTLDNFTQLKRLDILKIDVEGYEEHVLKGAAGLLSEPKRRPRLIFIEVHPYAWQAAGTTSDSLKSLLSRHGYSLSRPDNSSVNTIDFYGEIVAAQSSAM